MSLENQVDADTPPAFLWHTTEDDCVPVENSLLFYQALHNQGISVEMHIYSGMAPTVWVWPMSSRLPKSGFWHPARVCHLDRPCKDLAEKSLIRGMDMESKIERLLKELTLGRKIGMIHGKGLFETKGVGAVGDSAFKTFRRPHGCAERIPGDSWVLVGNSDDYVSYLPSNSALASTWNRKLAGKCGQVLGEEARGRGKDVILSSRASTSGEVRWMRQEISSI